LSNTNDNHFKRKLKTYLFKYVLVDFIFHFYNVFWHLYCTDVLTGALQILYDDDDDDDDDEDTYNDILIRNHYMIYRFVLFSMT